MPIMKPNTQQFPRKVLWAALAGLVVLAGILWYLSTHPSTPGPDSNRHAPVVEPVEPPAAPAAGADAREVQAPATSTDEELATDATPQLPEAPETTPVPSASAPPAEPSPAPLAKDPAAYAARISSVVAIIQANRAAGPEARQRISALLESPALQDQVAGLVLLAGLGLLDASYDLTPYPPAAVLAAVDLCGSMFADSAARGLLDQWIAGAGGAQTAGETAHTLLLEARLPYGGGATALELMIGINDPSSVMAGLYEFAVNDKLPPATRTEAFFLLRDHLVNATYEDLVKDCTEQMQQTGDKWLERLERLLGWMGNSSPVDRAFIQNAFAQSSPGLVEDLELYLRHEIQAGRLALDAEAKATLRETLGNLDVAALSGSDQAALQRLQRQLDSW